MRLLAVVLALSAGMSFCPTAQALILSACADAAFAPHTPCDTSRTDQFSALEAEQGSFGIATTFARAGAASLGQGDIAILTAAANISTGFGGPILVVSSATAEWVDNFRFEASVGSVTAIFGAQLGIPFFSQVEFEMDYGGTLSASGFGPWVSNTSITATVRSGVVENSATATHDSQGQTTGNPTGVLHLARVATWFFDHGEGVWFTTLPIHTSLFVGASGGNPSCAHAAGTCGLPGSTAATADYLGTASLTSVRVFAPSGLELTDFSLIGNAGTDYGAALRSTPGGGVVSEPATLSLVLIALAWFFAVGGKAPPAARLRQSVGDNR